jgi:hypothetical protein
MGTARKKQRKVATPRACYIYGLYDETGLRYIGQTRNDIKKRFDYHKKSANIPGPNRSAALSIWLRGGERWIMMIDHEATWDISEIIWIDRHRNRGANLLNVLRGGNDTIHDLRREKLAKPTPLI